MRPIGNKYQNRYFKHESVNAWLKHAGRYLLHKMTGCSSRANENNGVKLERICSQNLILSAVITLNKGKEV